MLSSTYVELTAHREAVQHTMLGRELFPIAMENDAALPGHNLISASLSKVDKADAYIGLISYRYGQTPEDPVRNPEQLSLTELEFRRAVERKIPICMFIMHGSHPVDRSAIGQESDEKLRKLNAFIARAKENRIYAEFKSVDDLRANLAQSLAELRDAIDSRLHCPLHASGTASPGSVEPPPGWEIVDRNAITKIRSTPPSVNAIVRFFDGDLATWKTVLAPGVRPRKIAERLDDRLRAVHSDAARPRVILLTGAGGEGKSTTLLHAAAGLVEDKEQAWTCLHRQATNARLPEDALATLPERPHHAWVVVIDDADNIAAAILAAVKNCAARTDIHLLLAAREAEWTAKCIVPSLWQPVADFHKEVLFGLDKDDARRIVSSWAAFGDEAMGQLKGRSVDDATTALWAHARDFATRKEDGELLGALLVTRQGEDMRAHVRALVAGLPTTPVLGPYSLRDVYAAVAAMHAENQLYLSRPVLASALGCNEAQLEDTALTLLQREAMLDAGDTYVLTRHRRIAETACEVLREDTYNLDQWYPKLAAAASRLFKSGNKLLAPDMKSWTYGLSGHFIAERRRWPLAVDIAKAIQNVEPANVLVLTSYANTLRRTERAAEALDVLKAKGEPFRNDRELLCEWGAVAGAAGDTGLDIWLCARSLADAREKISSFRCKASLASLGAAFRRAYHTTHNTVFLPALAACGQLGLLLENIDPKTHRVFEELAAEGNQNGAAKLALQAAIDTIRTAVIEGATMVEAEHEPVFFEKLLDDPEGYRYSVLQRVGQPAQGRIRPG